MARPRTYQQAARTHVVTVRVTPSEHARLSAEAAQLGISLAGLAERYLAKGHVRADGPRHSVVHPALIAELERIAGSLDAITATMALPDNIERVAQELSNLLRLLIHDEILALRLRTLKDRNTANDSAPASPRHEFQRVVHVRAARSESQD